MGVVADIRHPGWRPAGAAGWALVACVGLVGCTPANRGAVTLDEATGRPALALALCKGESVTSVYLHRVTVHESGFEVGDILWSIRALSEHHQTNFVIGQVPPGFAETTPLAPQLPEHMRLNATTDDGPRHGSTFELGQLKKGVLVQDGSEVSEQSFRASALDSCKPSIFSDGLRLSGFVRLVVVAAIASLMFMGVVFVVAIKKRPRTLDHSQRSG